MAVSLQQQGGAPGPLTDLELARQLQQEEYQQQQGVSVQPAQQVEAELCLSGKCRLVGWKADGVPSAGQRSELPDVQEAGQGL